MTQSDSLRHYQVDAVKLISRSCRVCCSSLRFLFRSPFAYVAKMEIESNVPGPDNITTVMEPETRGHTVSSALTAGIERADLRVPIANSNAGDKVTDAMNRVTSCQLQWATLCFPLCLCG